MWLLKRSCFVAQKLVNYLQEMQVAMENERLWLRQNRTAEGDDSVEPKDIFPD